MSDGKEEGEDHGATRSQGRAQDKTLSRAKGSPWSLALDLVVMSLIGWHGVWRYDMVRGPGPCWLLAACLKLK